MEDVDEDEDEDENKDEDENPNDMSKQLVRLTCSHDSSTNQSTRLVEP